MHVFQNDMKTLQRRTHYLLTSYRLSMMAFQNLVNEINEEKAHYRFHCLPNYTTDINRTMQIAKLLGKVVSFLSSESSCSRCMF